MGGKKEETVINKSEEYEGCREGRQKRRKIIKVRKRGQTWMEGRKKGRKGR